MKMGAIRGFAAAVALAALGWGCGSDSTASQSGHGDASASQGGKGGSGNDDSGGVGGFSPGGNGAGGSGAGAGTCAGSTVKAELLPIDMYIMLDKSGSMLDFTGPNGTGPSKWEAVTAALGAFFGDPGSAGLGVGIQFFPMEIPNVPDTCTSSAQCGKAGPCFLNACEIELITGTIVPCDVDSDCDTFDQCVPLGVCSNDSNYVCLYQAPGTTCGAGLGTCQQITQSFCLNKNSCDGADYAQPVVEISALPGAAQALGEAMSAKAPNGATPTGPALAGAIQHASDWAQAHPDHKVVAVLATDGLPTECNPQQISLIADIAKAGKDGSPGVMTFVIGVFGSSDVGAKQNVDQIAQAGGTGSAFFIAADQDVTQAFLDALHSIQGETLDCEYQIPSPPDGSELDYGKVNVEHTPAGAGGPDTVFYVAKDTECDPSQGGWYYDQDPSSGEAPTKMLMCPATCAKMKSLGGQVDIKMGCQTIVPEPK